jgi:hypothetical protein
MTEPIRELEDKSEFRIYEHMNEFVPQVKPNWVYKDTGESHINCQNATWNDIDPKYKFSTLIEAEDFLDVFTLPVEFHLLEDYPEYRIAEHALKFYPQKKQKMEFEEGQEVPELYKEGLWTHIFHNTDTYQSYEEALAFIKEHAKPAIIHDYQKKDVQPKA